MCDPYVLPTQLSANAQKVLERRYLNRDKSGKVLETPDQMFRRVADTIAKADLFFDAEADTTKLSERFYNMMTGLEFLPNSPTLMNAGRELGQLSACFVLSVGDSIEEMSIITLMEPPIIAVMEPVEKAPKGFSDPSLNQWISPPFWGAGFVVL